ncbi:hypothetical protein [Corynebacterium variabile]|uniref:hypothetical protein n=1 Tax=Corynebacterium variabile TaxID=1727 RepID=UPI003F923889
MGRERGNHLDQAERLRPGVGEVIVTAAARLVANPAQVGWKESSGAYSVSRTGGFDGFTLAEQFVLNRYRKRAL